MLHRVRQWRSQDFVDTLKRREEQAGGSTVGRPGSLRTFAENHLGVNRPPNGHQARGPGSPRDP
jgi:hypothetical protein